MGLDWNPLARPKPGMEAEFEALLAELDGSAPEEIETRRQRFQEISLPPFMTLGAPRVGFDAAADAWLAQRVEAAGKVGELASIRREMHGYYVLDLLPPCDGFPRYTHGGLYEGVDRCSFRAKFLDDVQEIIGADLLGRAYERMSARQLALYADALEAAARPWAARAGVAHVEHATAAPDGDSGPEVQADILFCAIRWCRFWSSRGHGLEPWF